MKFSLTTLAWTFAMAGALAQAPAPTAPSRPSSSRPAPIVATIKELMQGVVDPASDVLFDAVSFESTAAGVVEVAPHTDQDWLTLRRNAVLMAEVPNLLKMSGRRVAPAKPIRGMEGEPAGPEDLSPAQIQRLIDRDRPTFNRLAEGLQDAARLALKAVDERDVQALFASGEVLDQACENCHIRYWYPNDAKPDPAALSQRGKK